jgi:hypothetical protein
MSGTAKSHSLSALPVAVPDLLLIRNGILFDSQRINVTQKPSAVTVPDLSILFSSNNPLLKTRLFYNMNSNI